MMRFSYTFLLLLAILSIVFIGQTGNLEKDYVVGGINNATINYSMFDKYIDNTEEGIQSNNPLAMKIVQLTFTYIKALVFITFEAIKFIVEYVYDNEWIDMKLLYTLLIIALISSIIVPLIKVIIIGVIVIREGIQAKREKKELERLKKNAR